MKAQLLLRRAFCSSTTPSANATITHLSRTIQIHETRKIFDSSDSNSVSSWNSMVSEYFTNPMPREAQLLFDQMNNNNTFWTMPQDWRNDDASQGRRGGDVSELRKGIRKSTGYSWTEVGDKLHAFTRGDTSGNHPEHEAIMKFLDEWDVLLREAGYKPDCSQGYHSERLAVAYGLLKLREGKPLHVLKNLRVCKDCHAAIKLLSKVKGKEIIVRDAKRFHRFKNGECSCKDC